MKRFPLFILLVCAAGCASVKTSRVFHGVKTDNGHVPYATVSVENTGWFLFNFIPLASGNPDMPNRADWRFFRNTVTLENNLRMLDAEMRKNGATKLANVTSHTQDDFYYFFLLYRRACQTSAVVFREKDNPENTPCASPDPSAN